MGLPVGGQSQTLELPVGGQSQTLGLPVGGQSQAFDLPCWWAIPGLGTSENIRIAPIVPFQSIIILPNMFSPPREKILVKMSERLWILTNIFRARSCDQQICFDYLTL